MAQTYRNPRKITLAQYQRRLAQLPPLEGSNLRTVGIVGAGMAGLTAAMLLRGSGFNVHVFEASPRVGGRVRTLRTGTANELYAEAGAMRIPEAHQLTLSLCERFHLTTSTFPENDNNSLVLINGIQARASSYHAGKCHFGSPYTPGRTAEMVHNLTLGTLQEALSDGSRQSISVNDPRLDSLSLGEYLRAFTKPNSRNPITDQPIDPINLISNADIDLLGLDFGASDLKASLAEAYRDHETIESALKFQIDGGMDRLPRALAETMIDAVRFNARVTEILQQSGKKGFEIRYEHSVLRGKHSQKVDFVILAAPFSALTHVRLDQVLNPDRLYAIRTLHYDDATKIILEFSDRFWERDHLKIHGGRSFTDLPIRWVHYPSDVQHPRQSERGLLLASYTWGEDSLRWGSLREDDRIRFALRDVATLHDVDGETVDYEKILVGGMSHSWAEDEFAFGAFAIFDPHQETELFDNIWTPHNGIYFAGEHTSLKHAWIEGAVESGIRTACEIHDAVMGGILLAD